MDEVTILSYPGEGSDGLLSLDGDRSRYLLPFGGRFRVADFTVRNSLLAEARRTIIFNNMDDGLEDYVERYGEFRKEKFPRFKVVSSEKQDIQMFYKLIMDSNTSIYILYNGDNPSLIDFSALVARFRKTRKHSILYKMHFNNSATLAHTILVTNQKALMSVISRSMDEDRKAPNIFAMVKNILVNRGIETSTFHVRYWPLRTVPEYYRYQMDILSGAELFDLFYKESDLKSHIDVGRYARLGPRAKITRSIVSDGCDIDGSVVNSIIFPGVSIGEGAVIRDCILLPNVEVGARSRLTRVIMDERKVSGEETSAQNVGERCMVGSEVEALKNNDFPRSIFNGITLLGKNCDIPHGARVGGACYVAPGLGNEFFIKTKSLPDGMSITR